MNSYVFREKAFHSRFRYRHGHFRLDQKSVLSHLCYLNKRLCDGLFKRFLFKSPLRFNQSYLLPRYVMWVLTKIFHDDHVHHDDHAIYLQRGPIQTSGGVYATDGENYEPDGFRLMVTAVDRYLTENSKNAQLFVTENF